MDNAGSHRNIIVKEKITKSENTLLYSVPYRPKTNASETYIGYLKEIIKLDQISMTFNQLNQNVRKSIQKVKTVHCKNFIEYSYGKKHKIKEVKQESTWKHKPKNYKK